MKHRWSLACLVVAHLLAVSTEATGQTTEDLFRPVAVSRPVLNPSGRLLVETCFDYESHCLRVRMVESGESTTLLLQKDPIWSAWIDDDTLIVSHRHRGGYRNAIATLETMERSVAKRLSPIRSRGRVIDTLPLVKGELLWSVGSDAYRLPISELVSPSGCRRQRSGDPPCRTLHDRFKVSALPEPALRWIADAEGLLRAALTYDPDSPTERTLRYRADVNSRWQKIGHWDAIDDEPAIPVGFANGGRDLLVLSSEDRPTAALRRYDIESGRLGEVIFAHPVLDILNVITDYQGREVIGVSYEEAGVARHHYFDEILSEKRALLQSRFPEQITQIVSTSADRGRSIVLVSDSSDPGSYFLVDEFSQQLEEVGKRMPWVDSDRLSPVRVFEVDSADGLSIEAFLALPKRFEGARPPLVVMPHGGPLGMRDTRDFNPWVQSLAGAGFAVLQVNYRGSSGKGRGFLDAGRHAWGRGIEDDIETALQRVLSEGEVDPKRVCIFGYSYGGYSALISATRPGHPYRCAASAAGASDLLLLFASSDFAVTEHGRQAYAEIVGDPVADRERLIATSPAYQADAIDIPVLLVHGDLDRRVDREHSVRMRDMLLARGKPVEWLWIDDAEHATTPEQTAQILDRVLRFLAEHLAAP
ncbi:MAG: prolyl oligopeptidase family serine peptidase [Myxococcota bacterium]